MKLKIGISAASLVALTCIFAAVPASATPVVVYDNTGPGSLTTNAWSFFDSAYTVTDSFTLTEEGAYVQSANFDVWVLPGDSLTSVTWAITNTPYGAPIDSGNVAGGPNTQVATAFGYYPVLEESISIPNLALPGGTYWFQLSDGLDAYDDNVFWDESDGPSTAYESSYGQIPSETFQIIGNPAPEPSSFLLLGLGMVALAGMATRKKLLV